MILLPLNIPVWKNSRQHWNHEIRCKIYLSVQERFEACQKAELNIDKLYAVIETLAEGNTLDPKFKDHELTGNYKGTRECHIEPDWLLIYEIQNGVLVLMLSRLGTHSELFKK